MNTPPPLVEQNALDTPIPPLSHPSDSSDTPDTSSIYTASTLDDTTTDGFIIDTWVPTVSSVHSASVHLAPPAVDAPHQVLPDTIDATDLAPGTPIDSTAVPTIIDLPTVSSIPAAGEGDDSVNSPQPEQPPRKSHTTTARGRKVFTPSRYEETGAIAAGYFIFDYHDDTNDEYSQSQDDNPLCDVPPRPQV